MADHSSIEWTDATWNIVTGCTKVSAGCDHCYAETFAERFRGVPGHHFERGFDVTLRPERLDLPLRWKKPRRIFVNSMSDLFHDAIPDRYVARVFAVMEVAAQHTFQVLTKRHGRMRSLLSSNLFWAAVAEERDTFDPDRRLPVALPGPRPAPNVWLGVSVESQQWANARIPALLQTPASVRFLSCEPLLGPVDLTNVAGVKWRNVLAPSGVKHAASIDWVIAGGESGHGARLMQADWAQSLRDQCQAAGVPFLFKQWGEWAPTTTLSVGHLSSPREQHGEIVDDGRLPQVTWRRLYERVGKKAAGRELDGRTWDQFPEPVR